MLFGHRNKEAGTTSEKPPAPKPTFNEAVKGLEVRELPKTQEKNPKTQEEKIEELTSRVTYLKWDKRDFTFLAGISTVCAITPTVLTIALGAATALDIAAFHVSNAAVGMLFTCFAAALTFAGYTIFRGAIDNYNNISQDLSEAKRELACVKSGQPYLPRIQGA